MSERDEILARRRRFLTVALTAAGLASGCEDPPPPQVCLSAIPMPSPPDPTVEPPRPQVCLSPIPDPPPDPPPDAHPSASPSASAAPTTTAPAVQPSANVDPDPPRPHACLKMVMPRPDRGDPFK